MNGIGFVLISLLIMSMYLVGSGFFDNVPEKTFRKAVRIAVVIFCVATATAIF